MPQYIHDNTDDEFSHFTFINAYLQSIGAEEVRLDRFRTLKGSTADGVNIAKIGKRLTNLTQLTVDTSFWTRYRSSTGNPDLGDSFVQAIPGLAHGQFPAIPRDNNDTSPNDHIQAIVNTAGFHFAFIEQGGSSLYPSLAQRVTNPEVLRILLSIGPTETAHFQTWHDKAGHTDEPDHAGADVLPQQTQVPTSLEHSSDGDRGGGNRAVKALTDDGLSIGQVPEFFAALNELAEAADAARREG